MTPPVHACPLCQSSSEALATISDHFFGSPGEWKYCRCTAADCRVAFPSPAPTERDLEVAYSSYYTHDDSGGTVLPGGLEAWLAKSVAGRGPARFPVPLLGWLAEQVAWELGGMVPRPGLVVDIGAGDGARLRRLTRAGWSLVLGIEPDPAAVRVAQAAGLDVREGSAEKLPLQDGAVDAALMHHVIEHVRDPRQAFREAFRVLKAGGQLAVVTPNIDSLGRAKWGGFWRGYEAPRHLTIFTTAALGRLARETGFELVCNRSSARSAAWVDLVSAQAAGRPTAYPGRLRQLVRADQAFRVQARHAVEHGEEIVFVARKPGASEVG